MVEPRLGLVPVVGVLVQAVIGGITVLVDLHPAIVGGHLLISMALVAFSAWLVVRTGEGTGAGLSRWSTGPPRASCACSARSPSWCSCSGSW